MREVLGLAEPHSHRPEHRHNHPHPTGLSQVPCKILQASETETEILYVYITKMTGGHIICVPKREGRDRRVLK